MLGAINRRRDDAMKIKKNMILLAALSMAGLVGKVEQFRRTKHLDVCGERSETNS